MQYASGDCFQIPLATNTNNTTASNPYSDIATADLSDTLLPSYSGSFTDWMVTAQLGSGVYKMLPILTIALPPLIHWFIFNIIWEVFAWVVAKSWAQNVTSSASTPKHWKTGSIMWSLVNPHWHSCSVLSAIASIASCVSAENYYSREQINRIHLDMKIRTVQKISLALSLNNMVLSKAIASMRQIGILISRKYTHGRWT